MIVTYNQAFSRENTKIIGNYLILENQALIQSSDGCFSSDIYDYSISVK